MFYWIHIEHFVNTLSPPLSPQLTHSVLVTLTLLPQPSPCTDRGIIRKDRVEFVHVITVSVCVILMLAV